MIIVTLLILPFLSFSIKTLNSLLVLAEQSWMRIVRKNRELLCVLATL